MPAASPLATSRSWIALACLVALLAGALLVGVGAGAVHLAPSRIAGLLLRGGDDSPEGRILLGVRLPRVILAALVGAGLSLAGAVLQGLLKNPLADPFILGTSSGAALAATLAIAAGIGRGARAGILLPVFAFLGSLLALGAVYLLARTGGQVPVETLLLGGVIVNAFLFALVLLVLALSRLEAVEILLWLMGSLALSGRPGVLGSLAVMVCGAAFVLWAWSRDLDALSLGEEQAALLGVAAEHAKRRFFVVVSVLVGAAVSVSGIIGFVGLVVPHLARLWIGAGHRRLLPAAALLGASGLVLADAVARTALAPRELPVGVVTALAGAPFFLVLLHRRRRVF